MKLCFWLTILAGIFLVGQLSMFTQLSLSHALEGEFSGKVYSVQKLSFDQRVLVRLQPSKRKVAVHLPLAVEVDVGDNLIFKGKISQPAQAPNPGVFCYRSYLQRQGVFAVSYPELFDVKPPSRVSLLVKLRTKMRRNLETALKDPSLALALVLGERNGISSFRTDLWRKLGLSHLLAISGMHVGLLALCLGLLIQRLPLPSVAKFVCSQLVLIVYIVIAGGAVSTWRAFFFSFFSALATLRQIRLEPLHLWSLVGFLLLLFKPHLLFDLGFILSFAASGGILLYSPVISFKGNNRVLNYILGSLCISIVAQISTAPFIINSFGELALLGSLSTLFFVPLIIVLLLGGLGVAMGLGFLGLSHLVNQTMVIVETLEVILEPLAKVWIPNLGIFEILLWWGLFLYGGWQLRKPRITKPRRTYGKLVWALVLVLFIASLPPFMLRPLEVTAINVGQGDSFLVKTPSGRHLLIDGGGDSTYWQERGSNVGLDRLVPYLEHRKIAKLDYVILSHPHEDHLFGLLAVLEKFEIGMVVDNGHQIDSPTYQRYLEIIAERKIPHRAVKAEEGFKLGDGISLEILFPTEIRTQLPSPYNNNSLLLRLNYGGMGFLFTGDLENPILYDLVHHTDLDLKAQWLKVPHHGSRGSFLKEFYFAVDPRWAIIPVGSNSFGHPHQEVTSFLSQEGISWSTTEGGPVTFLGWWGLWGRLLTPRY